MRGAPGGDDYQKMWINPNNPDIIVVVSDQGAVISANRGVSWSNWYTQPTAAMYHVSTDNAFPYRVCSGQQDSGSACVDSRGNDGEITFRDWHPVSIQEYGEAAPDPKNPDLVYGSARNNVSLYNRQTGQTKNVGPNIAGDADATGKTFSRNVRTKPHRMVAGGPNVAVLRAERGVADAPTAARTGRASAATSRGRRGRCPRTPASTARASRPRPTGSITALSPSPLDVNVLWAGTDDGNIQVMTGRRAHVDQRDAAAIKPWTRIFNIEAGHFSALTAYAAANTMRLDDINPHFCARTTAARRGRKSTPASRPDAVSNSIREDPRQKGLLYACDRHAGVGVVRRRRPLAVAAPSTCRRSPCATSR